MLFIQRPKEVCRAFDSWSPFCSLRVKVLATVVFTRGEKGRFELFGLGKCQLNCNVYWGTEGSLHSVLPSSCCSLNSLEIKSETVESDLENDKKR